MRHKDWAVCGDAAVLQGRGAGLKKGVQEQTKKTTVFPLPLAILQTIQQ